MFLPRPLLAPSSSLYHYPLLFVACILVTTDSDSLTLSSCDEPTLRSRTPQSACTRILNCLGLALARHCCQLPRRLAIRFSKRSCYPSSPIKDTGERSCSQNINATLPRLARAINPLITLIMAPEQLRVSSMELVYRSCSATQMLHCFMHGAH